MEKRSNSQLIKQLNEIRILNFIRDDKQISRIDLAKRSRMSKVAVSEIVGRLVKSGFVIEIGKGESTSRGGKRPTLLKLNPNNRYVIGIDVKRHFTRVGIANIESNILEQEYFEYEVGISVDQWTAETFDKIDRLLARHGVVSDKLIGIGIAIPGLVNYEKGELRFADTLQNWGRIPIVPSFLHRYQVPVVMENDVNTLALAENLSGAGKDEANLICIWIGAGIGAGIIVDNHLIRGQSGNAGEIGYLELGHRIANPQFLKYLYSHHRFFGEILSEEHLLEVFKTKLNLSIPSPEGEKVKSSLAKIVQLGDAGNTQVQEILDEYAYLLAVLCTDLFKTINPHLVIISGTVIENSAYLLEKIRQRVKQQMMKIPFQSSSIVIGQLGDEGFLKGAVSLALNIIFEPPLRKNLHLAQYQFQKQSYT